MDHNEIERELIVERYLLGRLSPELTDQFEEHYLGCPTCLEQLESQEMFMDGLRRQADVTLLEKAPKPLRFPHPKSSMALAAVFLAAILFPLAMWQQTRQEFDLLVSKIDLLEEDQARFIQSAQEWKKERELLRRQYQQATAPSKTAPLLLQMEPMRSGGESPYEALYQISQTTPPFWLEIQIYGLANPNQSAWLYIKTEQGQTLWEGTLTWDSNLRGFRFQVYSDFFPIGTCQLILYDAQTKTNLIYQGRLEVLAP